MTTVSYYEPKKGTPGALAMVIALHAAGITALALWKIDVTRSGPHIIDIIDVRTPVDPPETPPEKKVETQKPAKPIEKAYIPPTIVDVPLEHSRPVEFTNVKPTPTPADPVIGTGSDPVQPVAPWIEHAAAECIDAAMFRRAHRIWLVRGWIPRPAVAVLP